MASSAAAHKFKHNPNPLSPNTHPYAHAHAHTHLRTNLSFWQQTGEWEHLLQHTNPRTKTTPLPSSPHIHANAHTHIRTHLNFCGRKMDGSICRTTQFHNKKNNPFPTPFHTCTRTYEDTRILAAKKRMETSTAAHSAHIQKQRQPFILPKNTRTHTHTHGNTPEFWQQKGEWEPQQLLFRPIQTAQHRSSSLLSVTWRIYGYGTTLSCVI